jgi:hypothetical protein
VTGSLRGRPDIGLLIGMECLTIKNWKLQQRKWSPSLRRPRFWQDLVADLPGSNGRNLLSLELWRGEGLSLPVFSSPVAVKRQ